MFKESPRVVKIESKRRQRTLARQVDVAGFGFWTGIDVVYSLLPAEENSGVRFYRNDLENAPDIPASVKNRVNKPRQTSLAVAGAQVDMVEHLLAALRAARIDNCDVVVTAAEAPGLDGSCKTFLEKILEAGYIEQDSDRTLLKIEKKGRICWDGGAWFEVAPNDEDGTVYNYTLFYDVPCPIPNQNASFDLSASPECFLQEIAPCRTFLTLKEAQELRAMGVCQRVTVQNALVFAQDGIVGNSLRFENECARHKLLDMVGDFALAPVDWIGNFRAYKTGHQQNAQMLSALLDICE